MKTKTLILIAMFISVLKVSGQKITYFDINWGKTSKVNASYYRLQERDSIGYRIEDHYLNGKFQMTGHSISGDSLVKEGLFIYYDSLENIESRGYYKNGNPKGEWKHFSPDGQLYYLESYNDDGEYDGNSIYYYPNGKIKRTEFYSNGNFETGKCFTRLGQDTTYFPFEEMPEFIGGEEEMYKYLQKNIIYPKAARKKGIQGIVVISFIVEKDGIIEEAEVLNSIDKLIDDAALNVVKNMPSWKPGKQDGVPVRVSFNLPISFKLE